MLLWIDSCCGFVSFSYLIYALSLPLIYPAVSYAAVSMFIQLYLEPNIHIHFSSFIFTSRSSVAVCSCVAFWCDRLVVMCKDAVTSFVGVESPSSTSSSGGLASLDALGKSVLEQSLSASTSAVQWNSRQQLVYVISLLAARQRRQRLTFLPSTFLFIYFLV